MNNNDLIAIGFKKIPHFTVTNSVIYDLGRRRFLSAGAVGTPNEMLFIYNLDNKDDKKITDIVTLHNYDHDGYLTLEKVQNIISVLSCGKIDKPNEPEDIILWMADCPYNIDAATVPKVGIEAAPDHVVGTLSLSYIKYKQLQDIANNLKNK